MASTETPPIEINTAVLSGGAILALLGSILVALGAVLGGTALFSAARKWMRQLETPPSETARTMLHHLQAATSAGVKAWHEDGPTSTTGRRATGIQSAA